MMKLHVCPVCQHRHGRSLAVDGLLIEDDKILLVKRKNQPEQAKWALPGGYVDFDETVETACIREFKEETGLLVAIVDFLGLFSDPARHIYQNISAAYIVKRISGKEAAGDDAAAIDWFGLDNLPNKMAFDHREIINAYIKTMTET